MRAREIMSKPVKTVVPEMPVRELAKFFMQKNISGAPVINAAGEFVGTVTEEDLIFQDKRINVPTYFAILANVIPLGGGKLEEEVKKIAGTQVADIMNSAPLTVSPETGIEEIATLMSEKKTYFIPVVQDEAVIGVITKRDVVRAVAGGKIW